MEITTDYKIPSDTHAEEQVVGLLVNYSYLYEESADILREEYFTTPKLKTLFRNIGKMEEQGEAVNIMTLYAFSSQYPTKGVEINVQDIVELTDSYDKDALPRMCSYLQDLYKKREVMKIGQKLLTYASMENENPIDEVIEDAVECLKTLSDDTRVSISDANEALQGLEKIVMDNSSGKREIGAPTGFSYFDETGGLQRSDLILIAARSSNGKTSLALDMAVNAAKSGYPVAYYTFEMPKEKLMARAISAQTGLSSNTIMTRGLSEEEFILYDKGVGELQNLPIYFDDRSKPRIERLVSSIRTLVHKKNVTGVFIDYMQVLSVYKDAKQSDEQYLGSIARRLKDIALELNIFVVLLNQINRSKDQGDSWQPRVDNIRGSGQINEAADTTLLIYRPEVYRESSYQDFPNVSVQGTAEIIIGKGRNIGTGEFLLNFDARRTHFSDIVGPPPATPEVDESEMQFYTPDF